MSNQPVFAQISVDTRKAMITSIQIITDKMNQESDKVRKDKMRQMRVAVWGMLATNIPQDAYDKWNNKYQALKAEVFAAKVNTERPIEMAAKLEVVKHTSVNKETGVAVKHSSACAAWYLHGQAVNFLQNTKGGYPVYEKKIKQLLRNSVKAMYTHAANGEPTGKIKAAMTRDLKKIEAVSNASQAAKVLAKLYTVLAKNTSEPSHKCNCK